MNNDLISRSELKKEFGYTDEWYKGRTVCAIIDNAPTVEYPFYAEAYQTGYEEAKEELDKPIGQIFMKDITEEEKQHFFNVWKNVRLQVIEIEGNPTGDWIDEGQYAEGHSEHYYRCSECGGHIIALRVDDFCKHCGADMRKGEE